jgi:hypothetical protein
LSFAHLPALIRNLLALLLHAFSMTALELSSNIPTVSESSGCCVAIDNMKMLTQEKYFLIVQIEGNSSSLKCCMMT